MYTILLFFRHSNMNFSPSSTVCLQEGCNHTHPINREWVPRMEGAVEVAALAVVWAQVRERGREVVCSRTEVHP